MVKTLADAATDLPRLKRAETIIGSITKDKEVEGDEVHKT